MSENKSRGISSQDFFVKQKTREEIIKEISDTESPPAEAVKKSLVISSGSTKADFKKIIKEQDIVPNSIQYRILELFCDEKKATTKVTKVFLQRIKNFSNEQLKIIELICAGPDFTTKNILDALPSIKKFESGRLLTLRTFVELDGVGTGPLNQFFMTTFPQSKREVVGDEAYSNELKEKTMRPDQVNVFYNICHRIKDITPSTAIAILTKARQLKSQHAQMINTFLKKDVSFGGKPINNNKIVSLLNLWLSLPELDDITRLGPLIKKLSNKSDTQKKDFRYLIQSFKQEMEKEKSRGNMTSRFKNFFS